MPQGRAFAPLGSRLSLVAVACGPGCPGLLRGRRAGWRPVGPEGQKGLDSGEGSFPGAGFGKRCFLFAITISK